MPCLIACVSLLRVTLRLKAKGLLAGLQTEWEDWQHDLLLDTIQLQLSTPGGLAAAAAAAAAGRQRRGRAEMEACTAAANGPAAAATGPGQEPRRVRASVSCLFALLLLFERLSAH
jgi:hypothetical protein